MRKKLTLSLKYLLLVGILTALAAACAPKVSSSPTDPPPTAALTFEDCNLSAPGYAARLSAECTTLTRPEDPKNPNGRQITLHIAILRAVTRSPQPDPLFFITGGPGQAATESYLAVAPAFSRINQQRDIVLIDQRGTGQSAPLNCPEFPQESQADTPNDTAALQQALQHCLNNLQADTRFYTTQHAIADLDAVRSALGYAQINLYGVSYGTRVALSYLQRYPQNVRSLILDGIVPQDEALGMDVARDAQRALDLIFERCANDPACDTAFPNLPQTFEALLTQLENTPQTVNLTHPISGEQTEITFTRQQMAVAVRLLSYSPETAALLPLLLHTAATQNDYAPLAAQYLIIATQLDSTITNAMGYSVLCSEDAPFFDAQQAAANNAGTYLQNWQIEQLQNICAVWRTSPADAAFKQPPQSNVPALLLSGEADPVTPPENGEQVARTLPNSLHLIAPAQGHNIVYRGCLPRLIDQFIETGSTQNLQVDCVQTIQATPFFLNFNGPNP